MTTDILESSRAKRLKALTHMWTAPSCKVFERIF